MPVTDLIEFVLYVTPGFLAVELFRAKYPVRRVGQFAQVCYSIIYGVIVFTVIKLLDDKLFKNTLHSNGEGFPDVIFITALLIGGIFMGVIRIFLQFSRFKISRLHTRLRGLAPDPQSIWAKVNLEVVDNWAVVFLDDGASYIGYIKSYKFHPDDEDNDFLLAKAKRVDENLNVKYEIDGEGVYLNTRNIKRIEFIKSAVSASSK